MGIRRFLAFLRQKSSYNTPLLTTLPNEHLRNATVAIDANNYFYKFLNTEPDSAPEMEQIFCALTSGTHDTATLALINDHLMQCETSSERHLLRCLYVFCFFCHTTLRIRHALFVLDGAAPTVKTVELVGRKQQKKLAHGKLLNERRALLLHRIYVLRWYQVLCIAMATLSVVRPLVKIIIPCRLALYRLLLNAFEWALGTELPERLFNRAAEATFLEHIDIDAISQLIEIFAKLRMNVQTSFLVELDFLSNATAASLTEIQALLQGMIETDALSSETTVTRPFLICIHIGQQLHGALLAIALQQKDAIEKCWRRCRAAFLICCVVHHTGDNLEFVFPESFQRDKTNAQNAFSNWERVAEQYWCNRQTFAHQHHHVWRNVLYVDWLCCEKSSVWLRSSSNIATENAANASTFTAVADTTTEQTKLMRFYCHSVPVSFGTVYDTRNDESHKNLLWNKKACALFESQHTPSNKRPSDLNLWRFTQDFFARQRCTGVKRTAQSIDDDANSDNMLLDEKRSEMAATSHTTAQSFGASDRHENLAMHLDEKHRLHVRHRIRDAYLQVVVHFLRVVCGTQMLVAEHEAEATCAKLCRDGFVNYVFTDDVDALTFGSPNIVVDWSSIRDIGNSLLLMGGTLMPKFCAKMLSSATILRHFGLGMDHFTMWCVLCGTDFVQLSSTTTMPVLQILQIVRSCQTIRECVVAFQTAQQSNDARRRTVTGTEDDIDELCTMVEQAFQFFSRNQRAEQSQFITRQFAPYSVDETINLQTICSNRKLAFAESGNNVVRQGAVQE